MVALRLPARLDREDAGRHPSLPRAEAGIGAVEPTDLAVAFRHELEIGISTSGKARRRGSSTAYAGSAALGAQLVELGSQPPGAQHLLDQELGQR